MSLMQINYTAGEEPPSSTTSESSREPESATKGAELNSALKYIIANDYGLCHLFPSHSFSWEAMGMVL